MRTWMRSKVRLLFMTCAVLLAIPAIALASDLDTAVVDTTSPFGSVTLSPGNSGNITINATVSGRQGVSTFKVYKDWTLSGGTFTGSNPVTFTVPARTSTPPPAPVTFTTNGTVTVDSGQAAGTFNLSVPAFDITNTATPNLSARNVATYSVTVTDPPNPCAGVTNPETPVITANPTSPDGNGGWYKSVPTISATSATSDATITYATQELGGTKSAYSSDAPTLGQGTTEVFAKATSATCNRVSESSRTFMVDTVAPTINDDGTTQTPNGAGWIKTAVTNNFSASDATSGLADTSQANFSRSSGSNEGSAVKINSGPVSDVAGNTNSGIDSAEFKIDLSDPTNVAFVGGPAAGGSYDFGSVPAAPTCTAEDAISGFKSCDVSGYGTGVGNHTLTATATDNADRTATATRSYSVLAATAKGFYQPVDMGDILNSVKSGSTVPVKFELFGGASNTEQKTPSAVGSMTANKVSCAAFTGDPVDAIEYLAPTSENTGLRFDTTGDQFIYNWKTPAKAANTCYSVTMTAADNTTKLVAYFQLK